MSGFQKKSCFRHEQADLFEGIQNLLALLFVAGLVFSLAQGALG